MTGLPKHGAFFLVLSLVLAAAGGGCGSSPPQSTFTPDGGDDATTDAFDDGDDGGYDAPIFGGDGNSSGGGDAARGFDVEPTGLQTLTVPVGASLPGMPPFTVKYTATLNGQPVQAAWTIDQGALGTIGAGPSAQAVFTANGSGAGLVNIIAGYNNFSVTRQVLIKIGGTPQSGPNTSAVEQAQVAKMASQLTAGGGVGGVGGVGLGTALTDMPTMMALDNPTGGEGGTAQPPTFLYPYDGTVFPRGLIAPLIQWSSPAGDADGIKMTLTTTSGLFSWTGYFGKPAILSSLTAPNYCPGTMGASCPYANNPIPQDVWNAATNTAGGSVPTGDGGTTPDRLTLTLTVAKGGVGYGPVSETWTIAPARLEGTVYYNSYGTHLVANSNYLVKNGNMNVLSGAAVLAINEGALAPTVVAGNPAASATDTSGKGCRVCHAVASGGSTLVVQHGDNYSETSSYNLTAGNTETVLNDQGLFAWAGLSVDGKLALTDSADLAGGTPTMQLYAFPGPTQGTQMNAAPIMSNLNNVRGGTPAFSPDGKHVAFDFMNGTIGGAMGNGTQLVSMDFDGTTNMFSNLQVLATMQSGDRAGFPSFFPTNDAVAFHYQVVNSNHRYNTWHGAQAQVWWSDLATGTATNLKTLNGLEADGITPYVPTGPNNHGQGTSTPANDTTLNYEPTVNPISSGGYIWVVFTSRRLYGNVATTDPWQSDPRNYDDSVLANVTTKKLWVAAIDLNAPAGTDPSHPAFYLPAQELTAGNSRGFWVLNPCKADGMSCMTGDECCNGYCEPAGDGGALICASTKPYNSCSMLQEKCTMASDCCDTTNLCINGFCAQATAQ